MILFRDIEVKRLAVLATLAILLTGLVLFGSSDTVISIADTSIPDNEVTSGEGSNVSASAGIVITMTGVIDE